jgi:hypothetical protein
MQLGRGTALIGGVAVVAIAALVYLGVDRSASEKAQSTSVGTSEPTKREPFTPERIKSLEENVAKLRARSQEAERRREERRAARAARAPTGAGTAEKATAPSGESASEPAAGNASAQGLVELSCASDPSACKSFELAFQLPGAIPASVGDREAVYVPHFGAGGEVWVREGDRVWHYPTASPLTDPAQVAEIASKVGN